MTNPGFDTSTGVAYWVAISNFLIAVFIFFEHVMFLTPIWGPIWQVILLPLAFAFFVIPDTEWTLPSKFPWSYPGLLYSWLVNKTLYFGSIVLIPIGFLGLPLNFIGFEWYWNFVIEDDKAI